MSPTRLMPSRSVGVKPLYEHNLNDLREMAQEDPRMVAMIIRSWMNANE